MYYSSTIPEYGLTMISLLPESEVFRTVNSMVMAFAIIIVFSILLSITLSLRGTIHISGSFTSFWSCFPAQKPERRCHPPSAPRPATNTT